jgi:hypothetical protein
LRLCRHGRKRLRPHSKAQATHQKRSSKERKTKALLYIHFLDLFCRKTLLSA